MKAEVKIEFERVLFIVFKFTSKFNIFITFIFKLNQRFLIKLFTEVLLLPFNNTEMLPL